MIKKRARDDEGIIPRFRREESVGGEGYL